MVGRVLKNPETADPFAVRRANFPDEISFFAPGLKHFNTEEIQQKTPQAFLPISLTGGACALQCDHCKSKILDPMIPLDLEEGLFALCERLKAKGLESVLISGGSMKSGGVPILKHIDDIARIKSELGLRVLVHTGVADKETAIALKEADVDGVMLDVIGADKTIRDIYHLDLTIADFDRSMGYLIESGHSVRPHIILGLHYGEFIGEYEALRIIQQYPVHSLILVILMPLRGTPMHKVEPPAIPEIENFFRLSRLEMPDTPVMLGCARPSGKHKEAVDHIAVDCGLNGIAYPAEGIVQYARDKGLKPSFFENVCSCGC